MVILYLLIVKNGIDIRVNLFYWIYLKIYDMFIMAGAKKIEQKN